MPFGTTNQGDPYGQQGVPQGSYGGPQQPHGLSPANADWISSFTDPGSLWQNQGENVPGAYGQTSFWNPQTGGRDTRDNTQFIGDYRGPRGAASWTDPSTGATYHNTGLMMDMFEGAGGGGGYQQYTPTEFQPGQVTPGEGYQQFDYSTIGSGIDPSAVIAAQEYKLQEAMEGDMARAGGRAGQSGFAMSTPYMGELGEAARKASQDRNAMTMQYQYDAAQAQAARDLAQQQQAAQLDFGGWQTGYQGDMQAQMFNAGQGMDHWSQINAMGFADNQGLNQYNQQNQMQGQNFLAGLLGGLL